MENIVNGISQFQHQIYGTEIPALQYIQQLFKVCYLQKCIPYLSDSHYFLDVKLNLNIILYSFIDREKMNFWMECQKLVIRG